LNPYALHLLSFKKGSSKQSYPTSLMGSIALIRQTLSDVSWYQAAHSAYLRNPNQPRPEWNNALKALQFVVPSTHPRESQQDTLLFESVDELTLLQAFQIREEFQLQMIYVGSNQEYQQIQAIQKINPLLILPLDYPKAPNVSTYEHILDLNLETLRHYEAAPANPSVLAQHQVPFAFTTYRLKNKADFWPNLRKAVQLGLSKTKALEALTTTPAKICGVTNQLGTLEKGKLANLVISDGDLFEGEHQILSVWIAGKALKETEKTASFAGAYELKFLDKSITIHLEDAGKNKFKGTEISGNTPLQNLTIDQDQIRFSVSLGEKEQKEVLQFTGRLKEKTLEGYGRSLSAQHFNFYWEGKSTTLPPKKEDEEKKESEEKKDAEEKKGAPAPLRGIGKRTYPNIAYGVASLP
ncbi:MAG: amidohydrolase family protein, partial [Simkania sp.]|nr:amidohydrolase family protein [Simkania sp.]